VGLQQIPTRNLHAAHWMCPLCGDMPPKPRHALLLRKANTFRRQLRKPTARATLDLLQSSLLEMSNPPLITSIQQHLSPTFTLQMAREIRDLAEVYVRHSHDSFFARAALSEGHTPPRLAPLVECNKEVPSLGRHFVHLRLSVDVEISAKKALQAWDDLVDYVTSVPCHLEGDQIGLEATMEIVRTRHSKVGDVVIEMTRRRETASWHKITGVHQRDSPWRSTCSKDKKKGRGVDEDWLPRSADDRPSPAEIKGRCRRCTRALSTDDDRCLECGGQGRTLPVRYLRDEMVAMRPRIAPHVRGTVEITDAKRDGPTTTLAFPTSKAPVPMDNVIADLQREAEKHRASLTFATDPRAQMHGHPHWQGKFTQDF
jgi:hypothetical protein